MLRVVGLMCRQRVAHGLSVVHGLSVLSVLSVLSLVYVMRRLSVMHRLCRGQCRSGAAHKDRKSVV